MSRYSTVIFDLDGTLIDTKRGILSCLEHTFNTLGLPQYPEPDRFLGPPLPDSFRRFCGMSESETDEAVRIFRKRYSGEELFNAEAFRGIPELLGELKDNGYTLAVATCKVEKYAVSILAHFGVDKYFDAVGGSVPERTQKREVIAHVLETLGISDTSRVLMVGDRDNDVLGAGQCGIGCLYALWGYGSEEEARGSGALGTVRDTEECFKAITE